MKIPPLKIFCVRHYTYEAGDLQESFTEYDKLGQNFAESEHVLLTIGQLKLSLITVLWLNFNLTTNDDLFLLRKLLETILSNAAVRSPQGRNNIVTFK